MKEFILNVMENPIITTTTIIILVAVILLQSWLIVKQKKIIPEITKDVIYDHLTGLLNKRSAEYGLSKLLGVNLVTDERRSHNDQTVHPVSLMIIDSDLFKRSIDQESYHAGDMIMQKTAKVIKEVFKRDTDILGRWSGEEFVVILAKTSLENSRVMAERVREAVRILDFNTPDLQATVSIGVACADCKNHVESYSLIKSACRALKEAKKISDRVCVA
jgi:diguanylate cyclase (GGDEF)-like protein